MNRRTFLALTGITVGLPSLSFAKEKLTWTPLIKTLPKMGQRIALVLFPLPKKIPFEKGLIQTTTIHIGQVLTVNHRPSPTVAPKITLKEEMRFQNYDGNGLFPEDGYALWYKRNLPYDAIEQSRSMKCLKTTVWWGGEHKLGTVYVWNARTYEPTIEWWAPIDQIPDILPPTSAEIYDSCRKKTKEMTKKWHHFCVKEGNRQTSGWYREK